ncbi:hypothetical protein BgiBS90_023179 [Biomphalaria glabrata]|nr:hypothetical protein BgiBS90_023179 [Biomphalaria glabrata]
MTDGGRPSCLPLPRNRDDNQANALRREKKIKALALTRCFLSLNDSSRDVNNLMASQKHVGVCSVSVRMSAVRKHCKNNKLLQAIAVYPEITVHQEDEVKPSILLRPILTITSSSFLFVLLDSDVVCFA